MEVPGFCNSGDKKLDSAVEQWLKYDKNPKTREEVFDDIKNLRWDKLKKTMLGRQAFGTAGLRGKMAAGFKCMNDVVVLQTAQGLCSYLKKVCNHAQLESGVVVGFDGRYNSKRFAELTAKVFLEASIPVRMLSRECPTPFVSFATSLYGCAAGVMVTASHNPKEDNGYKVYWGNGCQIITPHDDNILDEILQNLEIPDVHWNVSDVWSHAQLSDCLADVLQRYLAYVRESMSPAVLECNKNTKLPTVYTAMHGVGHEYIVKAFEAADLVPPISVVEQQNPDPDFPTVHFPNPEEAECLVLGRKLAETKGVAVLLANDPDADRLAVAERRPNGEWTVFSGNEMGALLGWWLLKQAQPQEPNDVYFIASIVSSKMLRAVAHASGCHFVETLTGFKWMGNTTLVLSKEGKRALFAFEEAIGYMCGAAVPDKDGVSAAVHVACLASHLYSQKSTLFDQLQALYREFGYHVTYNGYYLCYDPAVIQKIFRRIRNYDGPGEYPRAVAGSEVRWVHDLAAGVRVPDYNDATDSARHSLRVIGTGLDVEYTSGEMVMFSCQDGLAVTIRTSGTEPKIKFYTELVTKADTIEEQKKIEAGLEKIVRAFVEDLLQPKENGLIG